MKSKGSQEKRARAPIPSSNVLSVSEVECDDIGMDSSSGEEMEVEMDASTSKVASSDHTGSASTHINSPMPKGRRLTSKVWVQFRRYKKDGLFKSSCIKCGKTYASKSRNNGTSALRHHMSKPCGDGKELSMIMKAIGISDVPLPLVLSIGFYAVMWGKAHEDDCCSQQQDTDQSTEKAPLLQNCRRNAQV
ncbi:unnamed protein product [Linum tenue]|uniref:BED-type domain-containing protein n=1 Tax=Linum tenue TaxID=586396 RepID=A0AAV0LJX1_9ROSI|nr:unnamed protein product [Linum tenue]